MKTTIYELLGMIKDGKAPDKIKAFGKIYNYLGDDYMYLDEDMHEQWLFSENYTNKTTWLNDFLSEEVEILETTIKYNGVQKCTEVSNKIAQLPMINENELYDIRLTFNQNRRKINEIIDRINNE